MNFNTLIDSKRIITYLKENSLTFISIYFGTLANKTATEGGATEKDIYICTEDWTLHNSISSTWINITSTSSSELFFLAPISSNDVRTLFLAEILTDLPTAYNVYDFLVCNTDITATSPTWGDYDKVFKAYTLYIATGVSLTVFDGEEWSEVDRLWDDSSSLRSQTFRHDLQINYEVGDILIPEADIDYSGTFEDFTFKEDNFYFANLDYQTSFNPEHWSKLLQTNNEIEDTSAYQRIEVLNSGDTLTPSEKLSLVQEWYNFNNTFEETEALVQPYLSNFPFLESTFNEFEDSKKEMFEYLYGEEGILNDLLSPTIRTGLWSILENFISSFNLYLQLVLEDYERAKTQYEALTGFDGIVDGVTVTAPTTPNAITDFVATSGLNNIKLEWEPQGDVTNLKHYQVQASDDSQVTWHALEIDKNNTALDDANVTWLKGNGTKSIVVDNTVILNNIPGYSATYSVPTQGRTFNFRVRIITKLNSEGTWGSTSGTSEIPRIDDISMSAQRSLLLDSEYKIIEVEEIDGIPVGAVTNGIWADTFSNVAKTFDGVDLVMYSLEDVTDNLGNVIFQQYVADFTNGLVLGRWDQVGGTFPQDYTSLATGDALAGGYILRIGSNTGNDDAWLSWNKSIPFDPSKLYRIRARIRRLTGTQNYLNVGVSGRNATDTGWVDKDGVNQAGNQYYIAALGKQPIDDAWYEYIGYIGAHYDVSVPTDPVIVPGNVGTPDGLVHADPNDPEKLYPDARYFRPFLMFNLGVKTGQYDIDYLQVEEIDPETSYKLNLWSYSDRPFEIDGGFVSGKMISKLNPDYNFWDLETGEFKVGLDPNSYFHVDPVTTNTISIVGLELSLTSASLTTYFDDSTTPIPIEKEFSHYAQGIYWGDKGFTSPSTYDKGIFWDNANDDELIIKSDAKLDIEIGASKIVQVTSTGVGINVTPGTRLVAFNGPAYRGVIEAIPEYSVGKFFSAFRAVPAYSGQQGNYAGLYIGAVTADNAIIASGNVYNSAELFYPYTTTASSIAFSAGTIQFRTNTGLTPGAAFTPSGRMTIDSAGLVTMAGNLALGGSAIVSPHSDFDYIRGGLGGSVFFSDTEVATYFTAGVEYRSGGYTRLVSTESKGCFLNFNKFEWNTFSAGSIGTTVSATNLMMLTTTGLGIGIAPTYPLTVESTVETRAFFGNASMATGQNAYLGIGKTWSTSNAGYMLYYHHVTEGLRRISFGHYGKNNLLNILNNGNILIGTTTDGGYKLDVNGTARISGAVTLSSTLSVGGAVTLSSTLSVGGYTLTGGVGEYGSITVSTAKNSWYGLSCNGWLVMMAHSAVNYGLYDDNVNKWLLNWNGIDVDLYHNNGEKILHADEDGSTYIYANGISRIAATTAGAQITGSLTLGSAAGMMGALYLYGSTAGRYSRIVTTSGNLHIDADYGNGAASLYLNYNKGAGVCFGNGAGGTTGVWRSNGNVQIGTTTDGGYKLDVNGTARISGAVSLSSTIAVIGIASFADGTVGAPSITNTGDLNTGIYFPAADQVGITIGGVQKARFTAAGMRMGTLLFKESSGSFAISDISVSTLGVYALAFGHHSDAVGNYSVALGKSASASDSDAISIGKTSSASGSYSIAIGSAAIVTKLCAIAIGYNNQVLVADEFEIRLKSEHLDLRAFYFTPSNTEGEAYTDLVAFAPAVNDTNTIIGYVKTGAIRYSVVYLSHETGLLRLRDRNGNTKALFYSGSGTAIAAVEIKIVIIG